MSDYNRTTRECLVNQLHPDLYLALRNHFREHQLGHMETQTQACCETISQKKTTNKLLSFLNEALDTTVYTAILFTSERLIWARSGERSGIQLASADLKEISVRAHASILTGDKGLEIAGHIEGTKGMSRGFIGMESIDAAQKFCNEVTEAVVKINPPAPTKSISKWWGGTK